MQVYIYAHGRAMSKKGNGGWGYVRVAELTPPAVNNEFGFEKDVGPSRMQLTAAIKSLIGLEPCDVIFHTIDKEIFNYFVKQKEPKNNPDLWKILKELVLAHNITWQLHKDVNASEAMLRAGQLSAQGLASVIDNEEDESSDQE